MEYDYVPLGESGVRVLDCHHLTPKPAGSGFPYVAIPDIRDGRIELGSARIISPSDFAIWTAKTKPGAGDVLVTRRGRVGDTAAVPDGLECALGQDLVLLRSEGGAVDQDYLRWATRGPLWLREVDLVRNVGVVFDSLNVRDVPRMRIPLPPIAVQRKIAASLGALDDKIDVNRRMGETLEEIARALFQSWFVDFAPVRRAATVSEDIQRLFPDRLVDSSIGLIPEDWGVVPLGAHVENVRDQVDPARIRGDTPYIGLEHMPRGRVALGEWGSASGLESGKSAFKKGDVLFGKLRPYFHKVGLAPLDGICSTDILVLRPRAPVWAASALMIVSSSTFVDRANANSTGTRMPRTSWKDMSVFPIAVPPPDLLGAFQDVVGPMLSMIDATVHENRTLAELRDTLLPKLLSGEVRLKDSS